MPMLHTFKPSRAPVKRVKSIQFCIWDPEDLKQYSVVHVTQPVTIVNGEPKTDGLADLRMGSSERHAVCTTDGMDREEGCPGYFGHIELAVPLYHIGFNKTVLKILRCVGYHSSKLLLDPDNPKDVAVRSMLEKTVMGPARLDRAMKACAGKKTDFSSGTKQPKYKLEPKQRINIIAEFPAKSKGKDDDDDDEEDPTQKFERTQQLSAETVYNILKNISDEDCKMLGFDPRWCKPAWMMLTVLPVVPPHVRPAIEMDSTGRCEDDLTHHLASIIRDNQALKAHSASGSPAHVLKEYVELLQHAVITLMDNGKPGITRATVARSSRPVKSISQRLKGKHGRIRGNLMGKRVDFSARSVITGDALIEIDELGVPWSIARNLTVPERVTHHNIDWLQMLVDRGPHPPPFLTGAKEIFREDGYPISISHSNRNKVDMRLEPGYIVERHLQNGDFVVFNRAPSLHKMSMMAHKIRLLPYSTFRLNLSVTPPYNADFDGDEMNMHVPQNCEARAELAQLMLVSRNIVSPQSNRPVMKIIQDSLLASRLMTRRDTFISKRDFMGICLQLPDWNGTIPPPAILKPEPLWTGKQAYSMLLPDLTYRGSASGKLDSEDATNPSMSPTDCQVLIRNGTLLTGMLDKKALGDGGGGLIHIVFNEDGYKRAASFISTVQFVVNYWMVHHGFSCGIGDTVADPATMERINNIISEAKESVQEIIKQYQGGALEEKPGRTMHETFEDKVNAAMNAAREQAGKTALQSLRYTNNIVQMSLAGSKGSNLNISQMIACCAQQNVEGKRIPFGFTARTLPHFNKDNYGPESRGFVENSYLQGLSPQEFFFHAMGGREGLIDTAVKTANSGYIQRRLVKALEDLMIHYDNTVRSCTGSVVQFLYGEDGMDGVAIEKQRLVHLRDTPEQFAARFVYDVGATVPEWMPKALADKLLMEPSVKQYHIQEIEDLREGLRVLREEVVPHGDNEVLLPVNLQRLVAKAQTYFASQASQTVDVSLGPEQIINGVRELLEKLVVVPGKDELSQEAQRNATVLLFNHIRSTLASKRVLKEYKLTTASFNWLVNEVAERFHSALAQPGEMMGTVAAQSLGEPTTQMTLNTFHNAGVAAKNVTLGVPRLTEIINIAKNIKTPSLTIYLVPEAAQDQDLAKETQTRIEYTTVESVTQAVEIWYDPDPQATVIEEDTELVDAYLLVPEADFQPEQQSPWLLRIELDKMMMLDKRLECIEVANKISGAYLGLVHVINSEDNADKLVLRLRLIDDEKTEDEQEQNLFMVKFEHHLLSNVSLQGIRNVRKVFMRQEETTVVKENVLDGYERKKEWLLDSEGINLAEVLQTDNVDAQRTISNHVVEMFEVLGIEAARLSVLKELRAVLEFDGSKVNYRHMASLVDIMTARGQIMAITRHGINRRDSSPIAQSSFEETVEILFRAATFGEADRLSGVSENILLGQQCPLGTGAFQLVLDDEKLLDAIDTMGGDVLGMATGAYNPMSAMASPGGAMTPGYFKATPSQFLSPTRNQNLMGTLDFSPEYNANMASPSATPRHSPTSPSYSPTSPGYSPGHSPQYSPQSPGYSPTSPGYSPTSPGYSPTSPGYSPSSPGGHPSSPGYSPTSPGYSPTSPSSPTSPGHSPSSPAYSPTSPGYSPTSPAYSPTSPGYSPTSPGYSPSSPAYSPTSPSYSPSSPAYSPTSPGYSPSSPAVSPSSPNYSPASPSYSPTSPGHGNTSPNYSPTSPAYSPASPGYSPTSPAYSPTSPNYSPTSPNYSPTSPNYSPTSPNYSPQSPNYSPQSPNYSPQSPNYSPTSPNYSPNSPNYSPATHRTAQSPTSPHYSSSPAAAYSPASPHYSPSAGGLSGSYSPAGAPHSGGTYSPAGAPPSSGYSPAPGSGHYQSAAGLNAYSNAASAGYSPAAPGSWVDAPSSAQYVPSGQQHESVGYRPANPSPTYRPADTS